MLSILHLRPQFIMLYKVVLTFEPVHEILSDEQPFPVALFNVVRCSGGFRERGVLMFRQH